VNLARRIDRRERIENALSALTFVIVGTVLLEGIALYVTARQHYWDAFDALCNAAAASAVLLVVIALAVKFNRRHDAVILAEIKRRLEAPLLELFKLEYAGTTVTIEQFIDWREQYIRDAEHTYPGLQPIRLWIDAAKSGELPGAYEYRRDHEEEAINVDMAMSLILGN